MLANGEMLEKLADRLGLNPVERDHLIRILSEFHPDNLVLGDDGQIWMGMAVFKDGSAPIDEANGPLLIDDESEALLPAYVRHDADPDMPTDTPGPLPSPSLDDDVVAVLPRGPAEESMRAPIVKPVEIQPDSTEKPVRITRRWVMAALAVVGIGLGAAQKAGAFDRSAPAATTDSDSTSSPDSVAAESVDGEQNPPHETGPTIDPETLQKSPEQEIADIHKDLESISNEIDSYIKELENFSEIERVELAYKLKVGVAIRDLTPKFAETLRRLQAFGIVKYNEDATRYFEPTTVFRAGDFRAHKTATTLNTILNAAEELRAMARELRKGKKLTPEEEAFVRVTDALTEIGWLMVGEI